MRNSSKIIFIICSIMLISGICLRLALPSSTPLRLTQQPPTQSILLLPLDSRPVCSTMVQKLGALAGLNVILPPKACLDNYRTPSDRQKLLQWLQINQPKYDYSIISADNLTAYNIKNGFLNPVRSRPYIVGFRYSQLQAAGLAGNYSHILLLCVIIGLR